MGSYQLDKEEPVHLVKLSPFRVSCYLVTMGQYQRFNPGHRQRWEKDYGSFF